MGTNFVKEELGFDHVGPAPQPHVDVAARTLHAV